MHVLVVSYILPIIFPNTTTGLTNVFPGMYTQNKQLFCVTELHCIWLQRNVIHPLSLGAVGEGRGSMWNIESKMKTHGLAACPRHWQKQHRNNNNSKKTKKISTALCSYCNSVWTNSPLAAYWVFLPTCNSKSCRKSEGIAQAADFCCFLLLVTSFFVLQFYEKKENVVLVPL